MNTKLAEDLVKQWWEKAQQLRVLRSVKAEGTAMGFATCAYKLAIEAGVPPPPKLEDFLKRQGVL